ncbi:hypothetical protein D3C85_1361860 [compost metagenome]
MSDADDLPGTGQVGFGVDGIEDDEEVQVDLAQVHGLRSCCVFLAVVSVDHISVMNVYTRRE